MTLDIILFGIAIVLIIYMTVVIPKHDEKAVFKPFFAPFLIGFIVSVLLEFLNPNHHNRNYIFGIIAALMYIIVKDLIIMHHRKNQ